LDYSCCGDKNAVFPTGRNSGGINFKKVRFYKAMVKFSSFPRKGRTSIISNKKYVNNIDLLLNFGHC
jgi:hypothetical protein